MLNFSGPGRSWLRLRAVLLILLACCAETLWAMPASPQPFEEVQPDGTRITLQMRGDDQFNWIEDRDGYTVVNNKGRYEYAQRAVSGQLTPTGLVVGRDNPRALGLEKRVLPSAAVQALSYRRISGANGKTSADGVTAQGVSPAGSIKNLVVMIRFSNHTGRTLPSVADMGVLFNNTGPHALAPTGSVKDFYFENSYGQMTLNSDINPGVGNWITVSNTEQYYANGNSGDSTLWQALREALNVLDQSVDFRDYDTDHDGYIDSIAFIHSGYGAEWGGTDAYGTSYQNRIWSHRWAIQPAWVSNEGVRVFDYHISPGVWGTSGSAIGRIGVIVHETGHFFGLPDLYDTDSSSGQGIGSWGVMANSWDFGGTQRCPPHFSPWSKINLGWYSPAVISQPGQYVLNEAEFNPEVFRIDAGFPTNEYLLVENRQNAGFDCTIPQGGLIVWHIDDQAGYNTEGYPGQGNWPQNGNHYRVAVLQADGNYNLERGNNRGDSGDAHHAAGVDAIGPGPGNYPNTDTYQGGVVTQTGITISNISAAGASMTFCLNGSTGVTAPSGLSATAQSSSAISLAWSDNASDETGYELQRSSNGSTWAGLINLAANSASHVDGGLSPDSTWYYRIRAVRGGDNSAWSNTASATTFEIAPVAPASLTATAVSDSAIDLLWADSANNEDGYRVERSPNGSSWSTIATKGANSISHSDTNLIASTLYYYRVAAFNTAGDSGFASASATTDDPPPFVEYVAQSESNSEGSVSGSYTATQSDGGALETLTEQQSGGNPAKRRSSLSHTWTFNVTAGNSSTLSANAWSSGSSDGDEFHFEWSTDGSTWNEAFVVASVDSANLQSAVLTPAPAGTVFVRVTDTDNTQGHSATDSLFVDHLFIRVDNQPVVPPVAPTSLSATAAAYNQVDLAWTDAAGDETGYEVERADGLEPGAGPYAVIATLAADSASYSDTTVSPESEYSYRVRAIKGATASAYSNSDSVITPQQPAGTILLSASGYKVKGVQQVDLTWSGTAGGSVVIERGSIVIGPITDLGAYTDNIGQKGAGSYTYTVCNADSSACSNPVTVIF